MEKIMTVLGPIDSDQLGICMNHVHLMIDITCWHIMPLEASKRALAVKPLSMEILGDIRRDCFLNIDTLIIDDVELAIKELMEYQRLGGKSIVEVTLPGIGRDPLALKKISLATGINVICGTGWYVAFSHPPEIREMGADQLADIMVKELTEGIGNTGIRAGVIGEIALSGTPDIPFEEEEEKVLRAAARAQSRTGSALTIHPNFFGKHFHTYLDVVEQEGADLKKVYLSHMEMYPGDIEYMVSLLKRGVSVSFDQFGMEYYLDSLQPGFGLPTDRERVNDILDLLEAGYRDRIVLANEVALKLDLKKYGGYGYGHVLAHIVPELRANGVAEDDIRTMLIENPKRLLAF